MKSSTAGGSGYVGPALRPKLLPCACHADAVDSSSCATYLPGQRERAVKQSVDENFSVVNVVRRIEADVPTGFRRTTFATGAAL
jgi:hypothetical protein